MEVKGMKRRSGAATGIFYLHIQQSTEYYIHRSIKLRNNIIALIHLVYSYDMLLIVVCTLLSYLHNPISAEK